MRLAYSILHMGLLVLFIAVVGHPISGCTKNPFLPNKIDSTDSVHIAVHHDSAKFYASFDMEIANTSGVYADTFADGGSMIIYVVDGVVKFPLDSVRNLWPYVLPSSGSNDLYTAVWIPDTVGEINITGATGAVIEDTTVVIVLDESGTVSPKWQTTAKADGNTTTFGGESTPGWPLTFTFSLNQSSQYPTNLVQPGSKWVIWVYKDY
jgi:hypothetical protein